MFDNRNAGKTFTNRSSGMSKLLPSSPASKVSILLKVFVGTENANDSLKGRIIELSLADLNKDEEQGQLLLLSLVMYLQT